MIAGDGYWIYPLERNGIEGVIIGGGGRMGLGRDGMCFERGSIGMRIRGGPC